MSHTFHIPVLGLGYSIDTPLKVSRYGISSVVSIVDDELIERMREFHTPGGESFIAIRKSEPDYRARRVTAYLNLLQTLVDDQHSRLKQMTFTAESDISKYFELLPEHSADRQRYDLMLITEPGKVKRQLQDELRESIVKGSIDVNIMSKVDKVNRNQNGDPLGEHFTDALASLRGYAESNLSSSLILSAGMNPKLYTYLEDFTDFYPAENKVPRKKVILKVSDFRSAFIQAKFLAKKGLWIHEFRVESGLNCGGHAFATEGYLLGPILEEFKQKRASMTAELFEIYQTALSTKGIDVNIQPSTRVTVQGGIGTAREDEFLQQYYELDGTGWGSPFLLVPEATNVDADTLDQLAGSVGDDFYISGSSPLGIPFNNFRKSTAELQRLERIGKGRPGSPCTKKYLVSNTEFTDEPICTASRQYQRLKLNQLNDKTLPPEEHKREFDKITEKVCLCEGLTSSTYIKNGILKPRENRAVTICPGPNTAFFSRIYSLDEMVRHIYGKLDLLEGVSRPHVFVNEFKLYISYLKTDISENLNTLTEKKRKQLQRFKEQLILGAEYYRDMLLKISDFTHSFSDLEKDIGAMMKSIEQVSLPAPPEFDKCSPS